MNGPLASLLLFGLAAAAEAACPSGTQGPTINWAGVVCEGRHETDDFFSPDVQQCLKALAKVDRIPSAPAENCSLNVKYKTEICRSRVKHGRDKSISACVKSVESIPREVSHGIGG